jgi:phosphatidylserine/phosphatidylglycerophosphate/cardiolipin synthase-like enzyme
MIHAIFLSALLAQPTPNPPDACYHFSPNGGCSAELKRQIAAATSEIRCQLYELTSDDLAAALIAAKVRGVDVRIIVDKSNAAAAHDRSRLCSAAGVAVYWDGAEKIMHDKCMVVDQLAVTTGSYNWSVSAENANCENLIVIRDNLTAAAYLKHWQDHASHSQLQPSPSKAVPLSPDVPLYFLAPPPLRFYVHRACPFIKMERKCQPWKTF